MTTATVTSAATSTKRVNIEFYIDNYSLFVCSLAARTEITHQFRFLDVSNIRAALPPCVDLVPLYNYPHAGKLPADEQVAYRLIYEAAQHVLGDGLLWFLYTPRTRKLDRAHTFVKRLCIPTIIRAETAIGLHDDHLHLGLERLYATAKLR